MRSVIAFASLAIAACSVAPALSRPSSLAVSEASLRAADELQRPAVAAGDVQAVRTLMHPQYRVNAPTNRVMTGEEILSMFDRGLITAEPVQRTVEAAVVSGTTGLVMGRETLVPPPASQLAKTFGARTLQRRFTNVYSFENGRWSFLARHFTQAPQ
jgi:hypothetical protein